MLVVNIRTMHLVSSHYHIYRGNIDGSDGSAIRDFNTFFGDDTFDHDNSYTSSAFSPDEMWGNSFRAGEWTPANSQVYLADINGSGTADLIAVTTDGVYVSKSNGKYFEEMQLWGEGFAPVVKVSDNFGLDSIIEDDNSGRIFRNENP
ncbi:hypothetical protein [Photobacterium sp. DNB22_13_2]